MTGSSKLRAHRKRAWSCNVVLGMAAVILTLTGKSSCAANGDGAPADERARRANRTFLPDGIYGVIRSDEDHGKLKDIKKNQRIVKYDRTTWGSTKGAPTFLVVKAKPEVPFLLAEDPIVVKDVTDFPRLNCRLDERCADKLARFSKKNIGGRAALIIEGQVVMVATVRSPLTGGRLQISSCEDGTAEDLRRRLIQREAAAKKKSPRNTREGTKNQSLPN